MSIGIGRIQGLIIASYFDTIILLLKRGFGSDYRLEAQDTAVA